MKLTDTALNKMHDAEEGYEATRAKIMQVKAQMRESIPGMGAYMILKLKLQEYRETEDLYRQEVIMYATMLTAYATLAK